MEHCCQKSASIEVEVHRMFLVNKRQVQQQFAEFVASGILLYINKQ